MSRPDPTDWANKRKVWKRSVIYDCISKTSLTKDFWQISQAAVERAKQLRDERKKGTAMDDTEHTFTPQINQRPANLNKAANDSLDVLASTSQRYANNSNDVFEQPLPGNRSQQSIREKERERDGISNRGIPSPTSDALGNEMKRLSTREKSIPNLSATKSTTLMMPLPHTSDKVVQAHVNRRVCNVSHQVNSPRQVSCPCQPNCPHRGKGTRSRNISSPNINIHSRLR
jgi:hypothetical protein